MYCKKCGTQNPDEGKFCSKCGTQNLDEGKFCCKCGEKIDIEAEICPKCGVRQTLPTSSKKEKKEPWLAALARFFIPGLGQLYTKQSFGKAALLFCTFWLILPWIYSIYDAYRTADEMNEEQ